MRQLVVLLIVMAGCSQSNSALMPIGPDLDPPDGGVFCIPPCTTFGTVDMSRALSHADLGRDAGQSRSDMSKSDMDKTINAGMDMAKSPPEDMAHQTDLAHQVTSDMAFVCRENVNCFSSNPCTQPLCVNNQCTQVPNDGTSCVSGGTLGTCHASGCCTGCWNGSSCVSATSPTSCGASGGSCSSCDDGNFCTIDTCNSAGQCQHTAGNGGLVCDGSGDECHDGTCQACGATNEPCCASKPTTCSGKNVCQIQPSESMCVACGDTNELCCPASTGYQACNNTTANGTLGLVCGSNNHCDICGTHANQCCPASTGKSPCDSQDQCYGGVCTCGGFDQICCPGNSCNSGLTCNNISGVQICK
jgi:hypothetical protein